MIYTLPRYPVKEDSLMPWKETCTMGQRVEFILQTGNILYTQTGNMGCDLVSPARVHAEKRRFKRRPRPCRSLRLNTPRPCRPLRPHTSRRCHSHRLRTSRLCSSHRQHTLQPFHTPSAVDPLPPARGRDRERGAFRQLRDARHQNLFLHPKPTKERKAFP